VEWIIRGEGDAVDELMRACPRAFAGFDLLERDSFPNESSVAIYRRRDGRAVTSDEQKSEIRSQKVESRTRNAESRRDKKVERSRQFTYHKSQIPSSTLFLPMRVNLR
jgi:hypothetical protein